MLLNQVELALKNATSKSRTAAFMYQLHDYVNTCSVYEK